MKHDEQQLKNDILRVFCGVGYEIDITFEAEEKFNYHLKQYAEHMVQQERERIVESCKNLAELEMRHYGTDKHGLTVGQIEDIIKPEYQPDTITKE